jgi:hypothetical protein
MDELQALLSPTSLPCNSSTNPADVQFASLQLTVVNISQATVDLTDSGLRIEFVVDPGETGSASALILSQYSGDEPGTGSPTPTFPVEASPALGTAWTISQTSDAPCAFLAIPGPGAGQLPAGAPGQPPGSVSFVFANLAADLVPGASPVTVTVLPGSTATVAETPEVTKTGPAVGITSFTPTPLQLDPPDNQVTLTWSTVAAATCQLDWDQQDTTVVAYNGQQVTAPWTAPPQVTADAPVSATLFQDTQFTLGAGVPPVTEQQTVQLSPVSFTPSASTVSPWQPFTLNWSAFTGMGISMTWQPAAEVTVTPASAGASPIQPGDPLGISGTVVAVITAATTFSLDVTASAPPLQAPVLLNQLPVQVSTEAVTLSDFTASSPQVINAVTGQQAVTLSWSVQNAVAITITGDDGSSASPAYNASSAEFTLPLPLQPVTYTITAQGYTPSGTPPTAVCTVVPLPLEFGDLTAGLPAVAEPATGVQAVTLSWTAQNATGFTITGTDGSFVSAPADASSALLYLPIPPVEVTYTITAFGYSPTGVLPTDTVLVIPLPVSDVRISANPRSFGKGGGSVQLSWAALNATGFTITVSYPRGATYTLASLLPPNVTEMATNAGSTLTFGVAAQGYVAGPPGPVARVTVIVAEDKVGKEEFAQEKGPTGRELPPNPDLSPGPDAPDQGLSSGSQQAFIGPDERPGDGAHLRADGSGA